MPWIDDLLRHMVAADASDLHLSSLSPPMLRIHGDITVVEGVEPLSPEEIEQHLREMCPPDIWQVFVEHNDADYAYALQGSGRFRVNFFRDHKGPGAVLRLIPDQIPTPEQLGLPEAVLRFCDLPKGLVVVTGPTGSGKSTTLAAMISHINQNRKDHIITIEDPIEFTHPNLNCLINQREVGRHTDSFKKALRAALREDPDIVLVGEMRDLETIEIAIETAETGHLVFGTLHTTTAASTVDRIIEQFPADQQQQVRMMLSTSLKGVVAQNLCKRVGGGRVAAQEILVCNSAVQSLIREGKTYQIPSIMQVGMKSGMKLLNDALFDMVQDGVVAPAEALSKTPNRDELANRLGVDPTPVEPMGESSSPGQSARRPAARTPAPQKPKEKVPSSDPSADPFEAFRNQKKRR